MLPVGKAVATRLAVAWFAKRKSGSRRGRDLTELIQARFPLRRNQRPILDALVGLEDHVAEQLAPMLVNLAHELPEDERDAALVAVSNALEDANLSDAALFQVDLDPDALAAEVRDSVPVHRAGLSGRAAVLFDLALDRACAVLVHLVRELPEFNATTAVETLGRLGGVLDKLDQVLDRLPARDPDAPSGADLDTQFRYTYLRLVSQCYDHLEVIGLTTHHYEPTTTLTVAYLNMSVTDESRQTPRAREDRFGMDRWHLELGDQRSTENLRVEAALGDEHRTVIRGEAGAGKSTLLRWLAINAARETFTNQLTEWNGCVPFLVELRDFAGKPLPRGDDLLRQPSSPPSGPIPEEWVHRQFVSGQALLLVDGVDELTSQQRDKVRTWLRDLLTRYPSVRVVVTSRPTAVTPKWLLRERFRSIVLEPMNPADIQVFLRRWHQALLVSLHHRDLLPCHPEDVPEHERALLSQLQARAHLRALARNPLLCAMLCALNLDRRAKLPRDRLALYSAALDMLLERRDADRGVASASEMVVTANEKLVLLRVLAWWLNENSRTQMSREQALDRLRERLQGMRGVREDAETLLNHLVERSGVIRQPILGKIDFIHRTFQEFLAAKEAVDRDSIDLLIGKASSDLWRETVLMACAHASAEQRGRLLSGILDRAESAGAKVARQLRLLAAACRETATFAPAGVLDRVDACIEGLIPPRNRKESRSLATVGETILHHLPPALDDLSPAQAAACFRTAVLVNGPLALDLLARYATDPRNEVQREAVRSWRYFDAGQYTRRVLADAPLELVQRASSGHVTVDFAAAIPHLSALRNLRSCIIGLQDESSIDDAVCSELAILSRLRRLSIYSNTAPTTLSDLGRLTELESLDLNFDTGWPTEIDFLARLNKLQSLNLIGIEDLHNFEFLQQLPQLAEFRVLDSPILSWMDCIVNPAQLTRIDAYQVGSREELRRITATFPGVKNFWLKNCPELIDLEPLAELSLEILVLIKCPMINFASVAKHPTLTWITIDSPLQPVDLSPLADSTLTVALNPGVKALGIEKLGPGVKLKGQGLKEILEESS